MVSELSEEEVMRLLREDIRKEGGQSAWARKHGVSRSYLNKVLNGTEKSLGRPREVPNRILTSLNIRIAFVRRR